MKTIRWFLALSILITAPLALSAQQKVPLDHDAYSIWKQIQDEDFSRDGRWLVYRLVPGDGDATLVVENLEDGRRVTVPRGADPGFTADTRFLVALVEPAEEAVDAARAEGSRDAPGDSLLILSPVRSVGDAGGGRALVSAGRRRWLMDGVPDGGGGCGR